MSGYRGGRTRAMTSPNNKVQVNPGQLKKVLAELELLKKEIAAVRDEHEATSNKLIASHVPGDEYSDMFHLGEAGYDNSATQLTGSTSDTEAYVGDLTTAFAGMIKAFEGTEEGNTNAFRT
jgi:hypothetical protein